MAVSAAIVGAVAAVGGTVHAVESANQARRLAGQEKDRQKHDANVAIGKQKEEEKNKERIAMRDRQRSDQRRSLAMNGQTRSGSSYSVPLGQVGGAPSDTLIGS